MTYNKLRQENLLRHNGTFVGEDYNGNKYYEDQNAPYGARHRPPAHAPSHPLSRIGLETFSSASTAPHPRPGRTRWVEYPVSPNVWAIEDKQDASMVPPPHTSPPARPPTLHGGALQVSPDWHGWLHYMHDIKGDQTQARFGKPFKMQHRVNPTFLRPCAPPPWLPSARRGYHAPMPPHPPPAHRRLRHHRRRRDTQAAGGCHAAPAQAARATRAEIRIMGPERRIGAVAAAQLCGQREDAPPAVRSALSSYAPLVRTRRLVDDGLP